jgi:hypothetical protein
MITTKRTRFKITILAGVLLFTLAALSIFHATETIGLAAVTGMMTILSGYIWGETKRPSLGRRESKRESKRESNGESKGENKSSKTETEKKTEKERRRSK